MLWPMSLRDKSASRARFPDWAKRVGRGRPVASRSRVEAPSAVAGSRARPGRTSRPEKTSLGDSQGGGPPPESTGEELPGRARFCWPARPPRPRDGAAGAGDAACHATIAPPPPEELGCQQASRKQLPSPAISLRENGGVQTCVENTSPNHTNIWKQDANRSPNHKPTT